MQRINDQFNSWVFLTEKLGQKKALRARVQKLDKSGVFWKQSWVVHAL